MTFEVAEDRLRIVDNLRKAFPRIRFMVEPSSDANEMGPNRPGPISQIDETTLAEATLRGCYAYEAPEDWEPIWEPSQSGHGWHCANWPRFVMEMPSIKEAAPNTWERTDAHDDSKGYFVDVLSMPELCWFGLYSKGDDEARRWLQRFVRVVKRGMTNRICTIDPDTGRPRSVSPKGDLYWHAPGAIAWCRGAINRFFFLYERPAEDFDTYYWPPPTEGKECGYSPKWERARMEAYFDEVAQALRKGKKRK